jgi:hypothetical protein
MRVIIRVISLGFVALLTSCYLQRTDVVKERGISLQVKHEGGVSMSAVSAYQEGERLLISGTISQEKTVTPFSPWVQVTVILDNGQVFEQRCDSIPFKEYPGPRRRAIMDDEQTVPFTLTLPNVPPSGAVIHVVGSAQASLCT